MARISWHPDAVEDTAEIASFIARDSEPLAVLFVRRIVQSTARLRSFPRSGRLFPELEREDVREIVVGRYRLIYRLFNDDVQIIAVGHGGRQIDARSLPLDPER